ncbi:MAG TPA: hypothetical protein V6C96_02605, partial [Vampirovibrionales bacterium]
MFAPLICAAQSQESIEDELVLSVLAVNGQLPEETEFLERDLQFYLPVKQIAKKVEVEIQIDRINRTIQFESVQDNKTVFIDAQKSTISLGDITLEASQNPVFFIQQGFVVQDEILLEKALIEKFLDIQIEYDEINAALNLVVNRPLKALRQDIEFEDGSGVPVVKPIQQKLNIRSLQVNATALTNVNNSDTAGTTLNAGNQLNMSLVGDAYKGQYRVGPTFALTDDGTLGLNGFQQSWSRKYNEKFGTILGDSSVDFDPLNLPSTSILGVRVGNPGKLSLDTSEDFEYTGNCEPRTEILLFFNGQVIARQICKKGEYKFSNIPRLSGTENIYKIVQNNTDGTQITLKEENVPFYRGLIQPKEKRWEVFAGRPSITDNIFSTKGNSDSKPFGENDINKAIAGSFIKYGLAPKVNVSAGIAADKNILKPSTFDERYGRFPFKPLFSDVRYIEGQTMSFGLNTQPTDNLDLDLYGALSNSQDQSPTGLFRAGLGHASLGRYSYRRNKFTNQGSFYNYSPSFYTPLSSFSNRRGANMSFGFSHAKQSFGLNLRVDQRNVDGLSAGGTSLSRNILFNHNMSLSKTAYLTTFLSYNDSKNDVSEFASTSGRTTGRKRVNKWLELTMSTGFIKQNDLITNTQSSIYDITPGATFSLGKNQEHQISTGASFFTNDSNSQYIQGRFRIKENVVYQPSVNRLKTSTGDVNWLFSNGLFWEKDSGIRFGAEHLWNYTQATSGDNNSSHSFRVSALFNMGFADKKPYLMSSLNSGHLKSYVFVDANGNGSFDP